MLPNYWRLIGWLFCASARFACNLHAHYRLLAKSPSLRAKLERIGTPKNRNSHFILSHEQPALRLQPLFIKPPKPSFRSTFSSAHGLLGADRARPRDEPFAWLWVYYHEFGCRGPGSHRPAEWTVAGRPLSARERGTPREERPQQPKRSFGGGGGEKRGGFNRDRERGGGRDRDFRGPRNFDREDERTY